MGLVVARMTRHVTFFATDTDNEKMVKAAARAKEWRWPSDMHKYGNGKTRMKDGTVLGLAVMQRLLGNRTGDYPLVVLCLVANAVSAILVFLIASAYWNTAVGLLVWSLLVTCFWPYQLALLGAHICVAQTFFLAAVFFLQHGVPAPALSAFGWYFAAGAATGLMLFSSASARKYLPLLAAAFFYSQRQAFSAPELTFLRDALFSGGVTPVILGLAAATLVVAMLIRLSYKRIVAAMYFERAPRWLNRIIRSRGHRSLDHYLALANTPAHLLMTAGLVIGVYLLLSLAIVYSGSFYWTHVYFLLGVSGAVLFFTLPDVFSNLWGYYGYWNTGKLFGHFRLYRQHFASIGRPIRDDMRGAGWSWVIRFFWRVAPFHSALSVMCLFGLAMLAVLNGNTAHWAGITTGIVLLSLSPILLGEITGGPQEGRPNYPGLIGLLMLIAYTTAHLEESLPTSQTRMAFWLVLAGAVFVSGCWNLWVFLADVWPARMAPAWLDRTLRGLGVQELNTYDTPYNAAFVNALPPEALARYHIRFINTLKDVKDGYVVVPGTSAKAFHMESQKWAIEHGDFDLDPYLNRLIESKEIAKYAVASFKTFGTSRIWVHEANVPSYRDLILQEISDEDRWRGRGWVLDARKLQAVGQL
jgi:hypothetical protein